LPYIHGESPEEVARLATLNELMNRACVEVVRPRHGESILDVGCGQGQFTRLMQEVTCSRVLAIEADVEQISRATRIASEAPPHRGAPPIEWRRGDAGDLPLKPEEIGTFDLAHARFILEHVDDPQRVVQGIARALRPGGRAVLLDDDHDGLRLHPAVPSLDAVWAAYQRTYTAEGKDPLIGRRLPAHLAEAGLTPTRSDVVFFGACRGEDRFELLVANLAQVILGAAAAIAEQGVARSQITQCVDEVFAWSRREGAALWYVICFAEGIKRF
jgi:ubiquinone/menaquinone biosynthesis C-methylase UbiE